MKKATSTTKTNTKKVTGKTKAAIKKTQDETRLLLALWDLGGTNKLVKTTEVTGSVQRKNEKAGDYTSILRKLEKAGAIVSTRKSKVESIKLTDTGLQMLSAGLITLDFKFYGKQVGSIVASKFVGGLLKWIREMDGATISSTSETEQSEIAS